MPMPARSPWRWRRATSGPDLFGQADLHDRVQLYTKVEVDEVEDMDLADLVGQQVRVQTEASTPVKIFVARRASAVTAKVGHEVTSI